MGAVFRRSHNGQKRWVLKFRDAMGHSRQHRIKVQGRGEAERVLREVEGQVERQRLGLEEPPPPPVLFREIAKRWLAEHPAGKNDYLSSENRLRLHLLPALGDLFLQQISPSLISRLLAVKSKELGEWSVFHLRKTLVAMFNWARKMRLYRGENPAAAVPKPEIQPKEVRFLEPEVIPAVLGAVPQQHRLFCAIAVYCGLRKGEVCGLKWEDFDFKRQLIWIRRSYDNLTTKTRRARPVPIPDELLSLIADELPMRRSEYVCPRPGGGMRTKNQDAANIVRKAVRDAGLIQGYEHKCRRKGCRFHERRADGAESRCPRCRYRLMPIPVPQRITFHDLRSTAATHVADRTRDGIGNAQLLLGHRSPAVTAQHYLGFTRSRYDEIREALRFGLPANAGSTGPDALARLADLIKVGAPVGAPTASGTERARSREKNQKAIQPLPKRAIQESNLWPLAPEGAYRNVGRFRWHRAPSAALGQQRRSPSAASVRLGPIPARIGVKRCRPMAVSAACRAE